MTYPLVLDLAADGIPVAVTCRVLGFSKQAFYKWKANPVTTSDYERAYLINAALDAHADDPEFGYRFIADELQAQGLEVSRNTVHSLCKEVGIIAAVHRRRGSGKKAGPPVHDDHVQRVFTADDLLAVAHELNGRPRKSLDWDTPSERMAALLKAS